ncbi:hypothetical protein N0V82_006508 [Gnomoniopsis sp. IMI 355080]|nr:hypothetical protein N0V82_006508 [Gnomoniopsis sp. IMI 355080]
MAPSTISQAQIEVKHFKLALGSLQRYLDRLDQLTEQRKKLICIDDLIATISDAVLSFDGFENFVRDLATLTRVRAAILWFAYSKQIEEHVAKVQRHKASLTVMCQILQCESDLEASESQQRLQLMVEQVLVDNQKLKEMMGQMNDSFDAQSTITRCLLGTMDDDASTITGVDRRDTIRGVTNGVLKFAFERILETTWVYKRNERNECDVSFISSAQRSHAWSIFSSVSLADVSIKSVIAMPITTLDISNPVHYQVDNKPMRIVESVAFDSDNPDRLKSEDISSTTERRHQGSMPETPLKGQPTLLTDHSGSDCFISTEMEGFFPCKSCGEVLEDGKAYEIGIYFLVAFTSGNY